MELKSLDQILAVPVKINNCNDNNHERNCWGALYGTAMLCTCVLVRTKWKPFGNPSDRTKDMRQESYH